jgi:hypothetical protein
MVTRERYQQLQALFAHCTAAQFGRQFNVGNVPTGLYAVFPCNGKTIFEFDEVVSNLDEAALIAEMTKRCNK